MELPSWLMAYYRQALAWWASLGPDGPYYSWLAAGVAGLLVWAWISYRLLRRLCGHSKLRGTWYNEAHYREVMQMLHEDQEQGRRVLSYEEVEALRRYRYGDTVKDVIRHKGAGLHS